MRATSKNVISLALDGRIVHLTSAFENAWCEIAGLSLSNNSHQYYEQGLALEQIVSRRM